MAKPKIRKQNIFNTTTAAIKFVLFWVMVVIQTPILILLPRRWAVQYMPVFMWFLVKLGGIKIVVHGKISDARPLMVVSNHISVFEIATFPFAFRGSFIAKKEVENWPLVGWVAKKFGVIFVDRRPSHARDALAVVQKTVQTVKYPMILFPEGTTTNGAYVKPFKSTLFNFVENSNVTHRGRYQARGVHRLRKEAERKHRYQKERRGSFGRTSQPRSRYRQMVFR